MIVHEVLPPARTATLDAAIEHLFATDLEAMRHKLDEYALLWALRSHRDGKRPKWPPLQRAAHLVREMLLKGALFRGRREAIALALMMSEHHARKYRRLREVAAGEHSDLVALLDEDRLRDVFRLVRERAATCAAAGPLPERREPTPARERVLVAVAADAGNLLGPRAAGHPDAAGRPGRGARVG
jgi:(heptosyl)LPS beta-1,4-glucosyltransferase